MQTRPPVLIYKGTRTVRKTDNLPPSCVVTKSGNLNFLEPSGPVTGLLYLTFTHTVQADSGSDCDSESRRRSPHCLPAGWDCRVEDNYRR